MQLCSFGARVFFADNAGGTEEFRVFGTPAVARTQTSEKCKVSLARERFQIRRCFLRIVNIGLACLPNEYNGIYAVGAFTSDLCGRIEYVGPRCVAIWLDLSRKIPVYPIAVYVLSMYARGRMYPPIPSKSDVYRYKTIIISFTPCEDIILYISIISKLIYMETRVSAIEQIRRIKCHTG